MRVPVSDQWRKSPDFRIFSVVDEAYHVPSGARHVVGSGKSSDHTGASTAPAALNAANTASMRKPA